MALGGGIEWLDVAAEELEPDPPSLLLEDTKLQRRALADLHVLGLPSGLEAGSAGLSQLRSDSAAELTARYVALLRQHGEWGEVKSLTRVHRKLVLIGAGTPEVPDAESNASFQFAAGVDAGLKLTLGIFSVGVKASYTITDSLSIECKSGEAMVGFFWVPLDKEVRRWRPPGASEWFTKTRYLPVTEGGLKFGAGADLTTEADLLENESDPPVPVGGSAPVTSEVGKTSELSFHTSLGPKWGEDDVNSLSIAANVTGSVKITYGYKLPAGKFTLHWLSGPVGGCLVSGEPRSSRSMPAR